MIVTFITTSKWVNIVYPKTEEVQDKKSTSRILCKAPVTKSNSSFVSVINGMMKLLKPFVSFDKADETI